MRGRLPLFFSFIYKYPKVIVVVLMISFFYGCDFIHFMTVSEQRSENIVQSKIFLSKLAIDTCYSYQILPAYIDSLSHSRYQIDSYKLKHGTGASPVQLRMYNSSGIFLNGWTNCFGSIKRLGLLDSLPLKQVRHLPLNKEVSFLTDLAMFNINQNEKQRLIENLKNYDFIVVVFWAEWTGWYSKDLLKRVVKYKNNHKESTILLLTLNTSP